MENFRNAAKAFIVENGRLFMLKRRANDSHKPGAWDIPGGRLELGENPFDGLKREAKEEANLNLEIIMPLSVHHFTRDDGQKITLTIYWCKLLPSEIRLSEEHQEFKWIDLDKDREIIPIFFELPINNFKNHVRYE